MAKYTKIIADKIGELLKSGEYSIKQICDAVGISTVTFYAWKQSKPNFLNILKEAEEVRYENIGEMGVGALVKLLNGQIVEEVTEVVRTDTSGGISYETKTSKKYIPPNPAAVMKALYNLKSNRFKDKQEHDHNHKGKVPFQLIVEKTYESDADDTEEA